MDIWTQGWLTFAKCRTNICQFGGFDGVGKVIGGWRGGFRGEEGDGLMIHIYNGIREGGLKGRKAMLGWYQSKI